MSRSGYLLTLRYASFILRSRHGTDPIQNANRITQMQKWLVDADRAREDSGCAISLDQSRAFQDAIGSWVGGTWQ